MLSLLGDSIGVGWGREGWLCFKLSYLTSAMWLDVWLLAQTLIKK